jgi:hypothetical protein
VQCEASNVSRFVKLEQLDPYRLFGSVVKRSRRGMKAAYDAAFTAYGRCNRLLDEHHWSRIDSDDAFFVQLGSTHREWGLRPRRTRPSAEKLERIYAEAQAEDLQADYQASIVLLFADDALQRSARGVLGKAPGLEPGYGPEYGTHMGVVKFTTLLRLVRTRFVTFPNGTTTTGPVR